jgi:hypothetical protein
MNKTILEIKEEQKSLGKGIRDLKKERKGNGSDWQLQCNIETKSTEFRHRHIARCELRGRTREQIERHTKNPPNETRITLYKEEYVERIQEGS